MDTTLDYIAPDLRPLAVPLDTLNQMPNNARKHVLEKDVAILAGIFRTYGIRKAVVAKRLYKGVENAVLAGNGTLMAARQLGLTHLPVSWCDPDEPDETSQQYALADNRSAEQSGWDLAELSAQLADLADLDPGLPAALGWSEDVAGLLLAAEWQAPERVDLPTEISEAPATVVFSAAQHRVVQEAVARVRQQEGGKLTAGRCLELVCADFLSAPYPAGE